MTFQRILQTITFTAFIVLLYLAAFPLVSPVPVDLFLRMDPLVLIGTLVSARAFIPLLLPAVLIIGFTFFLGRFFCSHICPMGTTIDISDQIFHPGKKGGPDIYRPVPASLRIMKYLVLLFILGAALFGVSLVFLASPLSLITRLFGLVIFPVVALLMDMGLFVLRGAGEILGLSIFPYTAIEAPRYALQFFIVLIFASVFGCAYLSPRFWCRYLCPAGALLGLCSFKPFMRRRVDESCTRCGLCVQKCPTGAIRTDPFKTDFSECIVCLRCTDICPERAITFAFHGHSKGEAENPLSSQRRKVLGAGLAGAVTALVSLTGLRQQHSGDAIGQIVPPTLIRPPGAVPETDFLARCVRCGECMKACPTNTLQPIGLLSGFTAFASPVITPQLGPCEPHCTVCGQVCPTGTIRSLPVSEKIWAKVGTAYVIKHKCLAWEFDQECLVCDEVCPFDAVKLQRVEGLRVAAPFVDESRCNGCGFCEHHCPVLGDRAIVVEPMNALRLATGSYREQAEVLGFSFEMKQQSGYEPAEREEKDTSKGFEDALPPGFTE